MNRRDLARVAWPLLLLGMLTGGCADRTYLTPTYGRAYSSGAATGPHPPSRER
jgi:hypothetical protein